MAQKDLKNFIKKGSKEEIEYINKLKDDIAKLNTDFVGYAEKHSDVSLTGEERDGRMSQMNRMYLTRMISACTMPLSRGINVGSICAAIGTYAAMSVLSPDFREKCPQIIKESMYPFVKKMAEKAKPDGFWAKAAEKLERATHDGDLMYTPMSAAEQYIGFSIDAYNKMRHPGADIDKIQQQFNNAADILYARAAKDGISADVLNQSVRTLVGQLMDNSPEIKNIFAETAYDDYMKAPPEVDINVTMGVDGPVEHYTEHWQGEFVRTDGEPFTGTFSPRQPMTYDGYIDAISTYFETILEPCDDPDGFVDYLRSEEIVSDVQKHRDMFCNNMLDDGFSINTMDKTYREAMMQGFNNFWERHPEMEDAFSQWVYENCRNNQSDVSYSDVYDDTYSDIGRITSNPTTWDNVSINNDIDSSDKMKNL